MRASTLSASACVLSLAHARIYGIGVPATIKPGATFDVVVEAQNYIQSVTDVSIAFGYALGSSAPAANGLGVFITAFDLVDKSNLATDYNLTVTFPDETSQTGAATFTVSLDSLYGARYEPTFTPFHVSFTIGNETSAEYVYDDLN